MIKTLTLFSVAPLCLWAFHPAYAYDKTAFCTEMQETAKDHNTQTGRWVDYRTKSDEMSVDCTKKRVVSKQIVNGAKDGFKDGGVETIQTQWNANFCADQPFRDAIADNWAMILSLNFNDGGVQDFTAVCP